MAFIGILVLMGVVVNNGIILVEHVNNAAPAADVLTHRSAGGAAAGSACARS